MGEQTLAVQFEIWVSFGWEKKIGDVLHPKHSAAWGFPPMCWLFLSQGIPHVFYMDALQEPVFYLSKYLDWPENTPFHPLVDHGFSHMFPIKLARHGGTPVYPSWRYTDTPMKFWLLRNLTTSIPMKSFLLMVKKWYFDRLFNLKEPKLNGLIWLRVSSSQKNPGFLSLFCHLSTWARPSSSDRRAPRNNSHAAPNHRQWPDMFHWNPRQIKGQSLRISAGNQ